MTKFAVVATYEIAPEQVDVFLPLLQYTGSDVSEMSRAKEPQLYEIYEDEAAFTAHRNGPLVARFKVEAAAVERKLTFVTGTLAE
jgi:hypothetical protein